MIQGIAQALEQIKETLSYRGLDESATKQGVVLRLLGLAGWNIFDVSEVLPEHTVGSRRVDYALRPNSPNAVFIEVKRNGENLEGHQQQLLEYCFQQGVKLATLTNGRTWWLYLPLQAGNWEERRFLTIDLESQEPEIVEQRFMEHLSEEKVTSDQAVSSAEELVKSQQRTEITSKAIVEAWKQILETPDEILVDLIAETAERICGFKPETLLIEEFLSQGIQLLASPPPRTGNSERGNSLPPPPRSASPAGRTISGPQHIDGKDQQPDSMTFQGQQRQPRSWNDVLIQLCEMINELRPQEFDKVLSIRRSERASAKWPHHFSRTDGDLRKPKAIPNSDIYAEVDLNATTLVDLAYRLVKYFGYAESSLTIQLQ